jgi:hypothetical protein
MAYARAYLDALGKNVGAVIRREWTPLTAAADAIVEALLEDHSAYEYMAGHLMPGETADDRRGKPGIFSRLDPERIERVRPRDVVVMSHQYGVIERYVDVALAVKEQGAMLIAMAPHSDPEKIVRTHPSGTCVIDHADIVIDTHIPEGDVGLDAPAGGPGSCPTSGVIQAMLYWALTCGVAEKLVAAGKAVGRPSLQ